MLDHKLRSYKEQLLVPVAERLNESVHPTALTLIGFTFGVAAGLAAWQQMYSLGLLFWLLNRTFDGLDGTVARYFSKQTDLGGYLDILLDNVIYAFVVVMFAVGVNSVSLYIAVAFLLTTYYVNGASWMFLSSILEKRAHGARAQGEMTTVTMPTGLIEGTETVAFYIAFFVMPQFILPLFMLMGVLVVFTTVQRFMWAARAIG